MMDSYTLVKARLDEGRHVDDLNIRQLLFEITRLRAENVGLREVSKAASDLIYEYRARYKRRSTDGIRTGAPLAREMGLLALSVADAARAAVAVGGEDRG